MKFLALALNILWLPAAVLAAPINTPRPAPDFVWRGAGNVGYPLKKLRGQPVVILVAPTADSGDFRKQASRLERTYLQMSAHKVVFVAALTQPDRSPRPQSSVPFVLADNGPALAAAYGVPGAKFACIVVGPDGNIDLLSEHVEAAQRILDVMNNSFQPQAAARKGAFGGG